jgi:glycosyltransferase involved in cell wall biosynthesis
LSKQTTIILHYIPDEPALFSETIKSLQHLNNHNFNIRVISPIRNIPFKNDSKNIQVEVIDIADNNLSAQLTSALKNIRSAFVLYIDNRKNSVILKESSLDLYLLSAARNENFGLIYADYERIAGNKIDEIHLLKHHIGRLRDNQDYGLVYFINGKSLKTINFPVNSIQFNTLYDLRLKLSEQYDLIHISNRYSGSLYQITAQQKSHNVFDYLLSGKDQQLEAEKVLGDHLKRINAYLEPGKFYTARPKNSINYSLKASIIIPVNNRPDFIRYAIESVQAQTVQNIEIIVVVNGGSNDPTIQTVKQFMESGSLFNRDKPQVKLIITDINNIGFCINLGAQAAKGEYYVQLDSDDRLKVDAVEKILKIYKSDKKIGMVIGSYEVWEMQEDGTITAMEELGVITHDEWTEENGRNNLLRINGAGAPRSIPIELIKQIGFSMNEEPYARNYGEDYNMVLNISERYRIGRVWDAIYEVIRHSGGTDHSIDLQTIDRNDEAKDFMRKEAIKRRKTFFNY